MAVEKVGGGRTHCPADHVARPAGRPCRVTTSAKSVELPHGPISNPPPPMKVDTRTTFWRFHLQSSLS
jgi:hypothetical protein